MKTLTTAEKIYYLWHSDTPLTTSLAGVLQHHLGYEPPCENATPNSPSDNDFVRALLKHSRKRQKLEALPPAEIDLLFALARNAELKKTELQRLYNQPRAQADFPQWAKLPRWTVDETVALLLGKNPGLVNERYLEQFKYDDELAALERGRLGIGSLDATVKRSFSRQYKDLVTLVTRSEIFLPGTQYVDPVSVVSWARGNNISIPAQLEAAFAGKNARTVTWMTPAAEPSDSTPAASSNVAPEPQALPVVPESASGGVESAKAGPLTVVTKRTSRRTWRDVSFAYLVETFKAGQYATAKAFYKALVSKAGTGDSPFGKGTGENAGSLFVRETNKPLALKTLENAWAEIRTSS